MLNYDGEGGHVIDLALRELLEITRHKSCKVSEEYEVLWVLFICRNLPSDGGVAKPPNILGPSEVFYDVIGQ